MDTVLSKYKIIPKDVSLYFHFPLCRKKCFYCNFTSMENGHFPVDDYIEALVDEMRIFRESHNRTFSTITIYIGGGTPSLMEPRHVEKIMDGVEKFFGIARNSEITIEANPGTLSREKLSDFRSCGVNRLSLGVQSFNDSVLQSLGRIHSSTQAVEAFRAARLSGFANIGIDLICSAPGQDIHLWNDELRSAIDLAPEHISVYGLSIEDGTVFSKMQQTGRLDLPEEEESAVMFEKTSELLCSSGYVHYEISNYAKPGYMSRHNNVYWQRGNYLGFGAGSHSFLDEPGFGVRWNNPDDLEEYMKAVAGGNIPRREEHFLGLREAMAEKLFLGLRLLNGIDLDTFRDEFGTSFENAYPDVFSSLIPEGYLKIRDGRLMLAEKSLLISNQIFVRFL